MSVLQFLIDLILILLYSAGFLLVLAWLIRFWKLYINHKHLANLDFVMLEVRLPREIHKSPLAMEMCMNAFLQGGGIGSWYDRNFKGQLPVVSSLEVASVEGVVNFYIRVQRKFRPLVESNIYSQYPGIEIVETEDYTKMIKYEHRSKDVSVWGTRFSLAKKWEVYPADKDKKEEKMELPADFIPLKTYVDYGLDKDPKEEHKNDPILPLIEFLGSLGKGEYGWYQILVQDSSVFSGKKMPKPFKDPKTGDPLDINDLAKRRKAILRREKTFKKGDIVYDEYGAPKTMTKRTSDDKVDMVTVTYQEEKTISEREMGLTMEEKEELEIINRKLSKPLGRCIIRLMYVAKRENYNPQQIQNVLSILRPYNGQGHLFNSLGLSPTDPYAYPWQNYQQKRVPWRAEEMFNAYVKRDFFPLFDEYDSDKGNGWYTDAFFYPYATSTRNVLRIMYQTILHPFKIPEVKGVSHLNVEELASMYHFPGATATTPTLPRIDSTKGVAPVNLPI